MIAVNSCYIKGEQTLKDEKLKNASEKGGVNLVWWCQKGREIKQKKIHQKQKLQIMRN